VPNGLEAVERVLRAEPFEVGQSIAMSDLMMPAPRLLLV
jgi:hypothetical protein